MFRLQSGLRSQNLSRSLSEEPPKQDGMFSYEKNMVTLYRREQGAGGRWYVNERLQTLKTRLNLTRPSNTLVWMVAEAAIP